MIDLEFVERLIQALDESSLDTLELERGGTKIRLSKSPPTVVGQGSGFGSGQQDPSNPAVHYPPSAGLEGQAGLPSAWEAPEVGKDDHLIEVTSPMVGTFYRSPAPDAPPYVDVGGRVGAGSVLCIIEAMKLMNELESEVEGTIAKVLVKNAEPVEFGQVLFLVDPS